MFYLLFKAKRIRELKEEIKLAQKELDEYECSLASLYSDKLSALQEKRNNLKVRRMER